MNTLSWSLPGADNQPILGDTHLPPCNLDQARGVLLISHGFKGYKDYGFVPALAEAAAEAGLIAHRFNFSHSGMTDQTSTFEHPELFERDTWGKQTEDLARVALATRRGDLPGAPPRLSALLPQFWFGHSRGGVTTLLTAARVFNPDVYDVYQGANRLPPQTPAPAAVVVAAAPDVSNSLDDDQKRILRKQGFLFSPSARTNQDLRVGRAWLDEIEASPDAYDPCKAASHVRCPMLILHGDVDATVQVDAARQLTAAAGDRAKLHIVQGANHVFNGRNPLPPDEPWPDALKALIQQTLDFVRSSA